MFFIVLGFIGIVGFDVAGVVVAGHYCSFDGIVVVCQRFYGTEIVWRRLRSRRAAFTFLVAKLRRREKGLLMRLKEPVSHF